MLASSVALLVACASFFGGMRERVAQLGGQFEISSGVSGTTITAVLPAPPAALHAEPVVLGDSSAPDLNQNLVS